jgi:DNA-binding MurR/RpiR family transcriptional regulator
LLADYPSAGLGTVADLAERAGLARHRVMRFAQGLGYDGFTAVPSALREELTQRSKGPLGRVRWDIEHGSNSELLLRRARQVSDLALEHRICVRPLRAPGVLLA